MCQAKGEWRPAKVIEIADMPRSYLVKTSDGSVYRHNQIHLHKDTLQDQFDQYADVEINTDVNQPSREQKQQLESLENQQQKNKQYGYCTRRVLYTFRTISKST